MGELDKNASVIALVYLYKEARFLTQLVQYCQVRNINILNRVCRELTRLSRSKHTLVNIQSEHP